MSEIEKLSRIIPNIALPHALMHPQTYMFLHTGKYNMSVSVGGGSEELPRGADRKVATAT